MDSEHWPTKFSHTVMLAMNYGLPFFAPKKVRFISGSSFFSGIKWWIGICHIIHPIFLDKPCGWLRLGQRLMLCRSALILCLTERERSNGNITWLEYLVGGLEHFLFFHILRIIIPTDELIFFRGVGIPPTRYVSIIGKHNRFSKAHFPWNHFLMTRSLQAICSHVDPSLGFVNGLTLTIWDYWGGS